MTQRIVLSFFFHDSKNWDFCFSKNMTFKNWMFLFNVTPRIEPFFFWIRLTELNLFFLIWLKELNFFFCMTQRLERFFLFDVTQRIEPFSWYDLKNWTFLLTRLKGLSLFNMTQTIGPFFVWIFLFSSALELNHWNCDRPGLTLYHCIP